MCIMANILCIHFSVEGICHNSALTNSVLSCNSEHDIYPLSNYKSMVVIILL